MADPLADFRRASAQFQRNMARAMAQATRAATTVLADEMRGLASSTGVSLADLAAAGHPYARRFPPGSGPKEDWIVHEQDGDLLGSIKGVPAIAGPDAVTGAVQVTSPHAGYVVQDEAASQSPMRPRDFVSAAVIYQEDRVAEIYRKAHAAVHDVPGDQGGFRMDVTLGEHGGFAADLPEPG